VDERSLPGDAMERREESSRFVLDAYRERRRRRRGDDTYFGSVDALLEQVERGIDPSELDRRRSSLVREAEEVGMPRELAELLYEVAREEGLDPALAFELVRSGLGVCPPAEGLSNAASGPSTDKYLPPWMFPPVPTDLMLRERTLHLSFRRLRSLLEKHHDIDEAFREFASDPEVGHCGY
jgi:hypothetical protein